MDFQAGMNVFVEVVEEGFSGLCHPRLDLFLQVHLQLVERSLYLLRRAAVLIHLGDATLDVNARLQGPEDLVTRPEDSIEKLELLREQLEDAEVRFVAAVQEIDN